MLALLFELATLIQKNKVTDKPVAANAVAALIEISHVLGVLHVDPDHFLQVDPATLSMEIQTLLDERVKARHEKNWKKSDEIRHLLREQHQLLVEDALDAPKGFRVRWVG